GYRRAEDLTRGTYRVRGETLELFPAYDDLALRVTLFGDEVEVIESIDSLTGNALNELADVTVYPARHFVTPAEKIDRALATVQAELDEQVERLRAGGRGVAAERLRRHYRRRHVMARVGLYVAALLAAFICAAPFLWSLVTAFKQNRDLYNPENSPFFFNLAATPDHLLYLLRDTAFLTFIWNTLWVGLLVVAITLVLGLPAAYSLARLDRPWSGPMAIAIFFVYLVPPSLLFLSLSRLVVTTGLQDSTWSLVLVYPTITIPVSVWLLIGFLKAIPRDVEEQAMVDGYSRLAAFVRVVLPLAFPGIVAVVVFAFTLTASEFIYALAFVSPTTEKVVSTGVPTELIRGDVFFWQSLQAAAILVAVPIAFVFNLFLDRFISGFTMGAVKG
ncbi:MAG TPA: ABC transporter permease subunit, partial [Actinomycetota bacterium]|nr:ABC transporter permease subunit [Actinomycetota bacterium]